MSKKKYRWNPYLRIKNQLRNNMATLNSILYKPRVSRTYKDGIKLLNKCPSKLGIVKKAVLRSPKKPHSAKRATVKFYLLGRLLKKDYCYINGVGGREVCNSAYEKFLFRGGRRRDIPALKYTVVRGYTSKGVVRVGPGGIITQRNARSKFGTHKIGGKQH